jgi:hypothetical protein
MEHELLANEKAFADAIVDNDLEAIGRFVTGDWISSRDKNSANENGPAIFL